MGAIAPAKQDPAALSSRHSTQGPGEGEHAFPPCPGRALVASPCGSKKAVMALAILNRAERTVRRARCKPVTPELLLIHEEGRIAHCERKGRSRGRSLGARLCEARLRRKTGRLQLGSDDWKWRGRRGPRLALQERCHAVLPETLSLGCFVLLEAGALAGNPDLFARAELSRGRRLGNSQGETRFENGDSS